MRRISRGETIRVRRARTAMMKGILGFLRPAEGQDATISRRRAVPRSAPGRVPERSCRTCFTA